jgi:hypothetical protein
VIRRIFHHNLSGMDARRMPIAKDSKQYSVNSIQSIKRPAVYCPL